MQNQLFRLLFSAILLFLISSSSLFGQRIIDCLTELPTGYKSERSKDPEVYEAFLQQFKADFYNRTGGGSCINYAPIKAHIVRQSDGTGGLTAIQLNDAIDVMNTYYASSCMAFYLCGEINYIDDDNYYDFNTADEGALTGANNVANLINIYFCNSVGNGTDFYCGYAYYPGGPDVVLMNNSCTTNGSTLSHELGHFFSLPHTHNGGDELVDGSNCSTAGDEFCDTEADPQLGSSIVNSSCVYTGTAIDANGDSYTPNTHNIMSYSRKSCRDFMSVEQYAAMAYSFLNVRNYWDCPDFDVDFTVDNDNSCDFPFTANFSEDAVGETTYEWDFNNDGVVDATGPNPSHVYTSSGSFDVCLTVSDGSNSIAKVKTAYVNIGTNPYPYTNDMESFVPATNATGFADNWTANPSSTTAAYRWNVDSGGTPSNNTGPSLDQTTGGTSGIYIFTEATSSSEGDIAELVSPCIEVPTGGASIAPAIRFWYHMYGAGMGTLHIDLYDGTNWINDFSPAIVGQQQNSSTAAYLNRVFSVSAYKGQSIQIRFRGERGSGFTSDMAIDEFQIFNNASLPVELLYFDGMVDERGHHLLNWETVAEENSSFFSVEHSMDGVNFTNLGAVSAQGNTTVNHRYVYPNKKPQRGINYYRLKMVELDEKFEYSEVISLEYQLIQQGLNVFPNPSKGQYQLELFGEKEDLFFAVYNTVGQKVRSGQWLAGDTALQLDLSNLSNGIYTLQLRNGSETIATQKLLKY